MNFPVTVNISALRFGGVRPSDLTCASISIVQFI